MATNTGPQGVQSDTNASGLSTKLGVLIAINTKYRDVIIITKDKKGANKYDTGVSDGGIIRKYNNNKRNSFRKRL